MTKKEIKQRDEQIYLEWKNTGKAELVLALKYNTKESTVSDIITKELKKRMIKSI